MTERDKLPCYYAFIKPDSPFAPLKDIFSDGIPVFEVIKTRFENSDQCHYFWSIFLEKLTDTQIAETYRYFSWLTDVSINEIIGSDLTIPNNAVSKVLDSNLDVVNVKWAFLQQYTTRFLSTQNQEITMILSFQEMHFFRLCFCLLQSHDLLPGNGYDQVKPFIDQLDSFLTTNCPELKLLYDCFSSENIIEAIDNLN